MIKVALTVFTCAVCFSVLLPNLLRDQSDAAATIAQLEQQAVKADLATDRSFYAMYLTEDWSGGSSFGEWETKSSLLQDMSDPEHHHITAESIGDLKVRVYGNTAVATYRQSYEIFDHGWRHARTVITTDVWIIQNGRWREIASHSSEIK
jgi:hypothetical protein